ncbi:hypothetical protein CKAH01_08126 [Colletotrichum kahawae]|uniref:Uncharacterized protein n=1 Tax=Colletotrichum kahawae TaxID=34407 RepID=A0AAE0D0C9_COLKA|nr:hypothetical protein CKAH01_08126 [Colletotrichum kahawae]
MIRRLTDGANLFADNVTSGYNKMTQVSQQQLTSRVATAGRKRTQRRTDDDDDEKAEDKEEAQVETGRIQGRDRDVMESTRGHLQ